MKYLFFVSAVFCILSGTSLSATAQKHINAAKFNEGNPAAKSFKFIEGIEIKATNGPALQEVNPAPETRSQENSATTDQSSFISPEIEHISSLQFKYAQLLNRNVEDIKNLSLYNFIEEWWETRYRFGGSTKKGIDCSALTGLLMGTVFAVKLPRTAREQYDIASKLDSDQMTEGDLVFFNTTRGVSHVGVYLGEGFFVHASRNNGVTISSLDDPYYSSRFIGAGRVTDKENLAVCK